MKFRFRKSISFGNGVRINLSKSGIGYSCGFPGFRSTKLANGRNRTTISIPGSGISYVEESSKHRKARTVYTSRNDSIENRIASDLPDSLDDITNGSISEMQPIEYKSILRSAKWHIAINNLLWVFIPLLCLALYFQNNYYFIGACLAFLLKLVIHIFFRIKIEYSFEDDILSSYDEFKMAWKNLNKSKKHWQLIAQAKNYDEKRLAGTSTNYKREDFRVSVSKLPWYFKSKLKVAVLHLKGEKIYLLPDKMLVSRRWSVGAINHNDILYECYEREFVEPQSVPKDSKIIRFQWLYTNKDGSRDKRYKNNMQFPVCNYSEIDISSEYGLNMSLVISNCDFVTDLNEKIEAFKSLFHGVAVEDNQN